MDLIIDGNGEVTCIYDEMLDLTALGQPIIVRASHVEPDVRGFWWADLGPVEGPQLGPFNLRSQALEAERRWLEEHWLFARKQRDSTEMATNLKAQLPKESAHFS